MKTVLDLLYPRVCIICGLASDEDICPDCMKLVVREDRNGRRTEGLYDFGTLMCYARYSGVIKEVVARYKFRGEMWLGRRIGDILFDRFGDAIAGCDCIVYVPVSDARRRQRGFDQCLEIASELSAKSGIPVLNVFESISGNRRQSKLKRDLRKESVHGRFELKSRAEFADIGKLEGSRLLLIDDILTTGSTLRECAGLLVSGAGAETVDAMVFATGRTDIG